MACKRLREGLRGAACTTRRVASVKPAEVKMEDDTLPPSSMVEEEAAEGLAGSDDERAEGQGNEAAQVSDSSDDEELAMDETYDTKDGFVVNEDASDDGGDGGGGDDRCVAVCRRAIPSFRARAVDPPRRGAKGVQGTRVDVYSGRSSRVGGVRRPCA